MSNISFNYLVLVLTLLKSRCVEERVLAFSLKFILPFSFHDILSSVSQKHLHAPRICCPSSSGANGSLSRSSWGGRASLHLNCSTPRELISFICTVPASRFLYTQNGRSCLYPCFPQICTDIRLLANLKEMEEPFEKQQIGECDVKTWELAGMSSADPACLGSHSHLTSFCFCFLSLFLGRLKCNAVQEEPYALRAVLQPGPSPDGPHHGPTADGICAVV